MSASSSLTATQGIFDSSNPPIPATILMPQIDFDSVATSSYKSLADQTYTTGQFKSLLSDYPITTLDGITYVTGAVFIKKGHALTINGALVADGSISIGSGYSSSQSAATLTVVKIGDEPSGLLSKKNVSSTHFLENINNKKF